MAARAGTTLSRYWGNDPDASCKYANVADLTAKKQRPKWTTFPCDDHHVVSAPVGSFMANGYGLHDMLGNVWEWCEDVYNSEAYTKLPKDNPVYQGAGEYRVMRGGGWSNGLWGYGAPIASGFHPISVITHSVSAWSRPSSEQRRTEGEQLISKNLQEAL